VAEAELKYTYRAKGKYWRFRHPTTGDVALPNLRGLHWSQQPSQAAFIARYGELLAAVERRSAPLAKGSWKWIIARYKASDEFKALADSTQTDYTKTLDILDHELGDEPFSLTTPGMIKTVRKDFAATPRKAHKIKQMSSALYTWADGEEEGGKGLIPAGLNPARSVKRIKRKGGAREYVCWSEFEFDLFFAGAIRPMQTAAMIARYTGQRAEDIVRMVWTDFQGDMIRVRQSKTHTPMMIACHRHLRDYLNGLKAEGGRGVTILLSAAGEPYNANSLSSAIGREVKRVANMPTPRSIHGLRYMAGADMEEAGCTVGEIESVLGHHTFKMALKYATQRLRAASANAKRETADGV
jgi:integrase